jgi:hypothetical protein
MKKKTLEVDFLGEFDSTFKTALDHESEDQLSTFGEITFDEKSNATVPLTYQNVFSLPKSLPDCE